MVKAASLQFLVMTMITPDGTCIRDYVHVCDLVDAHILGLKWLENGNTCGVFNLGTGAGFSVKKR